MRRLSAAQRWLPIGYICAATALAALVLPSSLRPPPQAPPTSAQIDADSPPEDDQVLVSDLGRAASVTAGAGPVQAVGQDAPGLRAEVAATPRKGVCFGDPARQTFSLYASPCTAAWTGGNGGSTSTGVTGDEIHLVMWHDAFAGSYEGPVPSAPRENENSRDRTYRVWQAYMNARYETYGRRVRLWIGTNTSASPPTVRAAAVKAYEAWKPFAAVVEWERQQPACEELIRRQVICFNAPYPRGYYLGNRPYYWSWYSDTTQLRQFATEYICKKLAGKNAAYAGDPLLNSRPRKFAVKYKSKFGATADEFSRQLKDGCGVTLDDRLGIDSDSFGDAQAQIASGIARFKAEGISTIILDGDLSDTIYMTHQADAQGYLPEWLIIGTEAIDHGYVARLMSQNQWQRAFGLSGFELPRRNEETDCFLAYREVEPDTEPDVDLCRWIWPSFMQIMNGIQMAGPDLTPTTFEQGLFRIGRRFYPETMWAIGGGYAPGDYGYMDNVVELWWDAAASDPMDERGTLGATNGAYRYPNGGRRYRVGELTNEESRVFKEGVTEAPRSSR